MTAASARGDRLEGEQCGTSNPGRGSARRTGSGSGRPSGRGPSGSGGRPLPQLPGHGGPAGQSPGCWP
ncbi:hypothetical protein F7Q99_31595 [Streptomyces kaniharaensis]|uniref:Uncharacterized protein n=1 Tax=Streptomyces kaniharaensis TaxID=212423 RepID=A0A6N7L191_9ACTN|nr:hypothetical protein [Streptomyces kaniharaensis]